ncbi:hypothetical protein M413DRAFT_447584 [Hebeloma cylindrosporum]|uniref:Uncharacterized protein n=1 Tax=Hebeloma cylindrosporum TaxID=76867 RepID=A0A0C2YD13_HEBCY|nr:hypothetical protein M413DRAFT_447584 [Hebeloma cylindrosporum h7]
MSNDNSDLVSLIALIVSLVALVVTFLQAAQQYVATASDYRHCSERTLGGWHKRSRRQFIWSELRFEVHFSTPIIHVGIPPSEGSGSRDIYTVPTTSTVSEKVPRSDSPCSSTSGAQYILHTPEGDKIYTSSQNPWFLNSKGTRVEAKCTWLSLLNDTSAAHLEIGIDELMLSYDFMPEGIKKPLAQMDRKSFLTLMSLFQVLWQEEWGRDTKSEEGAGKRNTPTGAGPYCEVTSRDLANFGAVISYRLSNFPPTRRFYLASEKARSAMFNRFELGFNVVLTHSEEEVYRSAWAIADEDAADNVRRYYDPHTGYAPGLAEVIGCFAEPEMPKAIEHGTDSFVSIFSARSVACTLDDYLVVQLLIGEEIQHSTPHSKTFASWATEYISSLKHDEGGFLVDQLQTALTFAFTYLRKDLHQRSPIPWSASRRCLDIIKMLDRKLSTICHSLAPGQSELSVHAEFAKLQVRFGSTLISRASVQAQPSQGYWRDFIGAVVAEWSVEICSILGERYQGSRDEVRRGYVVNRLMRGVLWHIHNGNSASNQPHDERWLECSLNSRWLSDASTIWID